MRMLDLFSGIGGFSLAASWVWGDELEIAGFCEIDKFCQKVLDKNFPGVPIYEDIKKLKGDQFGTIDLVTGGFPCQPFSSSGKKLGENDNRALWPEMFRIIKESRPCWVVGENVARFQYMGLESMLFDLESIGYDSVALEIPACALKAPYSRKRWFVVSYLKGNRHGQGRKERDVCKKNGRQNKKMLSESTFSNWWDAEPQLGRVVDGIPSRLDKNRIKGLGNAIVPQAAAVIMQAIKKVSG